MHTLSLCNSPHHQTLFDQITDPTNLLAGWKRVRRKKGGQGGDGVTWQRFEEKLEKNLDSLHHDLVSGRYRPRRLRKVRIKKKSGGHRKLRIPSIRDRVAQAAAALALGLHLDPLMSEKSFAYRPGRSVEMAVHQVQDHMASGQVWVVDLDIKRFFDTIPHQRLMMELAIWGNDERFLALMGHWLRSFSFWRALFHKGRGLAQGSPLSPLLANLYLHPVDRLLASADLRAIRYADDILLLCETQQQAERARDFFESLIIGRGLSINRQKTSILHASQGFIFLGQQLGGPDYARKPVLDVGQIAERYKNAATEQINPPALPTQISRAGAWLALENH